MNAFRPLVVLSLCIVLSGCATPIAEAERTPQLSRVTPGSVVVGVVDQRADVVSGRHGPNYDGHGSGMYGIPIPHNTRSGDPMADHLAGMVASGFKVKGSRAEVVRLATGEPPAKAQADLAARPADHRVLLVLRQWWVNFGGFTTELEYDVEATVLDRSGRPVASKSFKGEDRNHVGGNANFFDEIEKAHRKRLETILNDEAIARAL